MMTLISDSLLQLACDAWGGIGVAGIAVTQPGACIATVAITPPLRNCDTNSGPTFHETITRELT
jgi:hypothetical protein